MEKSIQKGWSNQRVLPGRGDFSPFSYKQLNKKENQSLEIWGGRKLKIFDDPLAPAALHLETFMYKTPPKQKSLICNTMFCM